MAPDQIVRLTIQPGGDRLDHGPGMVSPAAFYLVQVATVDGDRVSQLRLGEATMPPPFANVVVWGRPVLIHVLFTPR